MTLLLLAFGWLVFLMVAALFIAYAIDWIRDRNVPFVQKMNAVSMMSSFEKRLNRLHNDCAAIRSQLDSYERNWVSVSSFCSLKNKVDNLADGVAMAKALRGNLSGLQHRVSVLEENFKEETK